MTDTVPLCSVTRNYQSIVLIQQPLIHNKASAVGALRFEQENPNRGRETPLVQRNRWPDILHYASTAIDDQIESLCYLAPNPLQTHIRTITDCSSQQYNLCCLLRQLHCSFKHLDIQYTLLVLDSLGSRRGHSMTRPR